MRKKIIPRIIINEELAFSNEEFYLRRKSLMPKFIDQINDNFSKVVAEVVSLSVEGNKVYVECIGQVGTHFVTVLTAKRIKEKKK